MKIFLLIWIITSMVLMIFGWIWILVDKRDTKFKKPQYIVLAVASFMMTAYFVFSLIWL